VALKVIVYVVCALYGFGITYYGMQWLRKVSFRSIQQGKYNPIASILYMLVGGLFLFIPALYDIKAFLISFGVSLITNMFVLLSLSKTNKKNHSQLPKENQ